MSTTALNVDAVLTKADYFGLGQQSAPLKRGFFFRLAGLFGSVEKAATTGYTLDEWCEMAIKARDDEEFYSVVSTF